MLDQGQRLYYPSKCLKSHPSVLTQAGSRPRHVVDCLADDTLIQTRSDHMQRPGDAEVHILIENLYKFKGFGGKKLIRKLSDKGWNVKSLNNLLRSCEIAVQ